MINHELAVAITENHGNINLIKPSASEVVNHARGLCMQLLLELASEGRIMKPSYVAHHYSDRSIPGRKNPAAL
jgi:hypothetical protein